MRALTLLLVIGAVGGAFGCEGPPLTGARPRTGQTDAGCCANKYDLLFVIDDGPSMAPLQQKLVAQLPTFMQVLQTLPEPPSLHVAVVSADLGAPSDVPGQIGCSAKGDEGAFQFEPRGACTETTLAPGATFIVDDPTTGTTNFGLPEATGLPGVFQCIGALGAGGCEFGHPLAAAARALGADGLGPPPPGNEGFLRADAHLGIIFIGNEDDCSAPADTTIYSLNGRPNGLSNPDGPLTRYRCAGGPRGGHACRASSGVRSLMVPLLAPPAGAPGTALDLFDCQDNAQPPNGTGTSALIPVSKFVRDIQALKPDPTNQILVAGVIGPPTPYAVEWDPAPDGQGTMAEAEAWPALQHACGPQTAADPAVNPGSPQVTTDGSFGDPGIREAQFLSAFPNAVIGSVCDDRYSTALVAIATPLQPLVGR